MTCASEVEGDLEDQAEDRKILEDGRAEDTTFVRKERPCPMPDQCTRGCRVCAVCNRKFHEHPQTALLRKVAVMMDGGLRVEPDELAAMQWQLLASMRSRKPW